MFAKSTERVILSNKQDNKRVDYDRILCVSSRQALMQ